MVAFVDSRRLTVLFLVNNQGPCPARNLTNPMQLPVWNGVHIPRDVRARCLCRSANARRTRQLDGGVPRRRTMKHYGRLFSFSIGILTMLLAATAAWADDPPGRVARLQYMSGSVSVQPRGTEDWVQGSANRPLTNADNIWTDKDSRAELNLGTGLMQMSSETSLTLSNVNNDAVQVQLHQGTLNLHLKHLYGGEIYEIDTPNLAFTVKKSGDYRFDVDPSGDSTLVTVRKGEGEATGKGPAVKVKSGKQARFTGGTSLARQIQDAPPPDGFD